MATTPVTIISEDILRLDCGAPPVSQGLQVVVIGRQVPQGSQVLGDDTVGHVAQGLQVVGGGQVGQVPQVIVVPKSVGQGSQVVGVHI